MMLKSGDERGTSLARKDSGGRQARERVAGPGLDGSYRMLLHGEKERHGEFEKNNDAEFFRLWLRWHCVPSLGDCLSVGLCFVAFAVPVEYNRWPHHRTVVLPARA